MRHGSSQLVCTVTKIFPIAGLFHAHRFSDTAMLPELGVKHTHSIYSNR